MLDQTKGQLNKQRSGDLTRPDITVSKPEGRENQPGFLCHFDLEAGLERLAARELRQETPDLWPRIQESLQPLPLPGTATTDRYTQAAGVASWFNGPSFQVAVSVAASLALAYSISPVMQSGLISRASHAITWLWTGPGWVFSSWVGLLESLAGLL